VSGDRDTWDELAGFAGLENLSLPCPPLDDLPEGRRREIILDDPGEGTRRGEVHKVIRKEKGKWILYDSSGKKRLGTHDTYASALRQERAIQMAKRRRGG